MRLRTFALVLIILVGFVVRWVYLLRVPAFTDEMDDVLYSLPVILGAPVPLTNFDTFNGGLYTGLIAAALRFSDLHWAAPRLISWLAGGLTVCASYALGRASGGHRVGLLSAVLMALAPAHILINSHVAWSHSLTPLFTTSALALVSAAGAKRYLLAPAGVFAGLALQSHASTIALLPGALPSLWALNRSPRVGRWLVLAGLLVVLVESPVIVYNVTGHFESLQYAMQHRRTEDRAEPLTAARYVNNLGLLLNGLTQTLGGSLTDREEDTAPISPLTLLTGLMLAALGVTGLFVSKRWLLLGSCLTFISVLPVLNSRYLPTVMNARYLMPLVPVVFVGVALSIVSASRKWPGLAARACLIATMALILGVPLWGLSRYISAAEGRRLTTDATLGVSSILAVRHVDSVILDEAFNSTPTLGGGRVLKSLMALSSLQSRAYQIANVSGLPEILNTDSNRYAVLAGTTATVLRGQPQRLTLTLISVRGLDPTSFGVYLVRGVSAHEPFACLRGAITSWSQQADGSTAVALDTPRAVVIDAAAKAASVSLRELDRVQRPVGQSVQVCVPEPGNQEIEAELLVRAVHQLTFLPLPRRAQ